MYHKVTGKKMWRLFSPFFYFLIGVIISGPVCMVWKNGLDDILLYAAFTLIVVLLFLVPQSYIHYQYYQLNKSLSYKLGSNLSSIEIIYHGNKYVLPETNISKLIHIITPPQLEGRFHWLPWDNYEAYVLQMNDGKQFVLTSMLGEGIRLNTSFSETATLKRIIPFVEYKNKVS